MGTTQVHSFGFCVASPHPSIIGLLERSPCLGLRHDQSCCRVTWHVFMSTVQFSTFSLFFFVLQCMFQLVISCCGTAAHQRYLKHASSGIRSRQSFDLNNHCLTCHV